MEPVPYRLCVTLLVVFILSMLFIIFFGAPVGSPDQKVITISSGATVAEAARTLKDRNVIRSPAAFSFLVRVLNSENGVIAGTYSIPGGENTFSVAYRLTKGITGLTPVKVTVPEGFTAREIGALLKEKLGDFDAERFVILGEKEEGYLFPDTYFFLPGVLPENVIATMRRTFDERVETLIPDIKRFGKLFEDVIIMASLIEKEARQTETRRTVAGILWKRLDHDMFLQVDAVFGYIMGTTTFSPSFDDLKINSPYNTYQHAGLPPGAIANPGLDAIEAAVTPIETPYWYYLTDAEGVMHYAKTFEEHQLNRARYLR